VSPGPVNAALLAAGAVAFVLGGLRWLRVAQREHYLPGYVSVFARRWWGATGANRASWWAGVGAAVASVWYPAAGFLAAAVAAAGPAGLHLRGRTSNLAWTQRLRRLALVGATAAATAVASASAATAAAGGPWLHGASTAAAMTALGSPAIFDFALWALRPIEARLLRPYLDRARRRLADISPRVVAITGSYGKTTTKGYVAHLASSHFMVVATPASFNNQAGLARAVNEHLSTGAQVFVAEMGTYGPGEIKAMCSWATPEVAVITAIGPVHLERMGSLEKIAEAKAEILERAKVAVLNVDYPLLADLAIKAEDEGKVVWRCSAQDERADVFASALVGELRVKVAHFAAEMEASAAVAPEVEPGNVACAVAVALSLGVPPATVAARLSSLPQAPHRRTVQLAANGAQVVDDTYNSNPAGARAALALLSTLGEQGGKKVVVTPGMVELGPTQARENAAFAASAAEVATELAVVGRTNARALLAGARAGGLEARCFRDRAAAVSWASANLGPGDAVLYENDLPDHYP
jgi:UDP-N-acetylmuramoyl-tripeptide--D-alanyl-D-alanine ligase